MAAKPSGALAPSPPLAGVLSANQGSNRCGSGELLQSSATMGADDQTGPWRETPRCCQALHLDRLIGTWFADFRRASGHLHRVGRPDKWPLPAKIGIRPHQSLHKRSRPHVTAPLDGICAPCRVAVGLGEILGSGGTDLARLFFGQFLSVLPQIHDHLPTGKLNSGLVKFLFDPC